MTTKTSPVLTQAGKEELALALLLWKDFKSQGRFDVDITMEAIKMAGILGVAKEFNDSFAKLPPMRIVPRDGNT